ncbi:MAG: DUF4399 domain-containing protein [Woeseiaceae bacterium]
MIGKTMNLGMSMAVLLCLSGCSPDSGPQEPGDAPPSTPAGDTAVEATTLTGKPSPDGATASFITPQDGAVVSSPVQVEFSIEGMDLVPAGNDAPNSGHHHILIDAELPDMTMPIPADANHVHFGDGSTSAELTLPPGEHTLQLLFADYLHIPHDGPVYSERITVTVE